MANHYTIKQTPYGYKQIINENGPVLTVADNTSFLEADGYAFKDLNGNGTLEPYEDWRLPYEQRAEDLANRMAADGRSGIEAIAGLMLYSAHTAVTSPDPGDSKTTHTSQDGTTIIDALTVNKIRHILVTSIKDPETGARWNNNIQAYCEKTDYGIPANNSSDPRNEAARSSSHEYSVGSKGEISLWPSSLGMAATFDPELVKTFGKIASKEYRALGIATALSPQIDLATEPRWSRVSGTFGEGVELATDMARAYVDGFQTTYDTTNGWGKDSVNAMVKHWPGGGPEEGGRDAHYGYGKYAVYPGNMFDLHLKTFTEGAFNLSDGTGKATAVMPYYTISHGKHRDDDRDMGNGYNSYIITDLLRNTYHYDGVLCTDWMVLSDSDNDAVFEGKCWGLEDIPIAERYCAAIKAGMDQFGGSNRIAPVMDAYDILVKEYGEEAVNHRFAQSAKRLLMNIFRTNLFEDPYLDPKESAKTIGCPEFMEQGYRAQQKSVVLLKNNGIIGPKDPEAPRKKVYIPSHEETIVNWFERTKRTEVLPTVDLSAVSKYYDVTDNPAEADFAIVGMKNPDTGTGYDLKDKENGGTGYVPISLQYAPYTAEYARETALANDPGKRFIDSDTGDFVYTDTVENRSYRGKSVHAVNEDYPALLKETKEKMHGKPVIVYMKMNNPMVWSEVEPVADAIVVGFGVQDEAVLSVIAGEYEPMGLLPMQQPANMKTVEEQKEDVPLDMECYRDAAGNLYDYGFGLNWSGVIDDERVRTYVKPRQK